MMGKMTIQEVAKILVERNGLDTREANRFATEMFAVILERLQQGEPVKVKGLGTFKIINVEARESVSVRTGERVMIESHSKVTFTPDATMKELVNKPFSQFETVVLNEGVEFEDIKDDITEEELAAELALAEETPVVEEAPIVEEPQVVAPVIDEPPVIVEPKPVYEEPKPVYEEPKPVYEEPKPVIEEDEPLQTASEEGHHWSRWLLAIAGILALVILSAYGGYEYGRNYQLAIADTVFVSDTVYVAEQTEMDADTAYADIENYMEEPVEEVKEQTVVKEQPIGQKQPEVKEQQKQSPATDVNDKYAQKDERVRLGAYRIVGTAEEVTVLAGQTFYSICRAHLGPDMECYVEVYNDLPRNPQIKAGQVLKIPKLELKKKRK